MISYDNYINRIQKVAKVKNFVVKYKFLIIGVLAVIIAGVTALLATKGMVTSAMVLDARYSYGESYSPTSATAFLSDVTYEYSVKGTDEWTAVKPVKVGTYLARTVTDKAIGKGYGDPVEFEILPKEVELSVVSDSMTYGDAPVCAFDEIVSAYGDRIYSAVTSYELPKTDSPEDMQVDVTINKVIVLDKDGNDSSECYSYSPVTKTLTLNKRALNVTPVSRTETYSGAPVSTEVEIDPSAQQTLDSINDKISSYNAAFTLGGIAVAVPQNAGVYGITLKDVKISHSGVDVTHLYNISYGSGATLNIAQKSLSITTASAQKIYDGSPISKDDGLKYDGLISGHKLSVIGSVPSRTDAGTTTNTQIFDVYDAINVRVTDNYNISYEYGTLTVTPREVTVTLNDIADVIYGNPVVYGGGGKITNAIGECTVDIKNVNLQYSPLGNYSYPDAGSYQVICDADDISIRSGGSVTANYKVTAVNGGSLTITPRQISVTLYSDQVEYGTTLPVPSHAIGGDGLASGEQFNGAYLYDGAKATLLNVGSHIVSLDTSNCSFTNRYGGAVSASNYTITSVGTSTITVFSRGITVYLKDETAVYGNTVAYSGGYKSVSNLADGQTVAVDASKVVVPTGMPDVGDNYIISCPVNAIQILNNGTDVTANYTVAVVQGTFKITPRPITVQAEDMSGVIYGEEIEYTGNYANEPDLVIGETLTVLGVQFSFNSGTIPAVGDNYAITPNGVQILKADGTNSTNNYQITPSNGKLEIVQRPITIRSEDKDFVYNGYAQYYEGNSVAANSPYDVLRDKGHRIVVSGHATITDVGTTSNALDYTVYDSFNNPVTANYKITKAAGTLKVTARPISVTLNTYSAIYGDSYAYATGAGNYANYPDLVGGDTLEITAVNYEFGSAKYPDVREAAYRVSKASFKITKPDGRTDSTSNYNVTWTDGALTIERRTITVVLNTYSAIYGDSYAYATGAGNYANTPDLVSGETLEITAVNYEFGTAQYPDVRETAYAVSLNEYKILKSDGTTSSYNNYTVIPVDGALTITKRAISVTLKDLADITYGATAVYFVGGEEIVNAIGNCTVNFDTSDLQFNAKAAASSYSYPDAGDYNVELDSDLISILSGGADVTGNYSVTVNSSSLTINKRTITVYLYDYSVDYGDEHDYVKVNNGGYDYLSFGSLASFDGVEETLKITSVTYKLGTAKYPVVGEYGFDKAGCEILKANGAVGNNNYAIDFDGGLLTVNERAITLTSNSYEWVYDGAAHNGLDGGDDGYEITDGSLPDGDFKIVPTALTSVTNYSTETTLNKLSYDITYNGVSVIGNFDLTAENTGILKILQRHIKVYTASESKEYDGVALSNGNYKTYLSSTAVTDTTAEDGLIGSDKLTVIGELPSITNFGTQENSIAFNPPNDNYVIDTVEAGTLEITKRPIKVETGGAEKTYDGYALTCGDITATYGGEKEGQPAFIIDGEKLTIVGDLPARTNAGSSDNAINFTLPNDNYYVSETVYGKLVVKKRKIGVRMLSYSVVYGDSYAYPTGAGNYEEIYEGSLAVVNGVSETLEITNIYFEFGNAQYPDAREETYGIGTQGFNITKVDGTEGHDNYILAWVGGELTVTKRPIIVNIEDTECVYGEAELPTPNFTVTGVEGKDGLINDEMLNITSFNREREDGTEFTRFDAGKYTVSVGEEYTFTDASGIPLTAQNYEIIDCNTGTLTINKRPITVTLKDITREYGEIKSSALNLSYEAIDECVEISGDYVLAEGETLRHLQISTLKGSDGKYPTMKNVGSYDIEILRLWVKRASGDIDQILCPAVGHTETSNYEVSADSVLTATLTITPKDLTVELDDVELTYGEREKALDGYLVEVTDGLAFEESLSLSKVFATNLSGNIVADSYLDAGDYKINANDFDAVIYDINGAEIENGYTNYNIDFVTGNLKVNQRTVNITLNDMPDAVYGDDIKYRDGGEEVNGLLDWHRFEINPDNISFGDNSVAPKYLNVGEYSVNADEGFIKIFDGENEVTQNYKIEATGGSLTVTARKITVTLDNAISVYGEPLGVPQTTVTNLANNDEFKVAYLYLKDGEMPARYDIGDYDISLDEEKCSFVYTNGAPSSTQNYQVVLSAASTLTVTKRPITVTLKDITREYGEINAIALNLYYEAIDEALEISGDYGFAEGETKHLLLISTLKSSDGKYPTMKNVGSYDVQIRHLWVKRASGDVDRIISNAIIHTETSNYEISANSVLTATLTVTPKAVEFDLGSIELTYGDKDNALDGYTFDAEEGLAFNQTAVLSNFALVDGLGSDYRLSVGTYYFDPNRLTVTVYEEDGVEDTYGSTNYDITVKGELVIKPKTINIQLLDFYNIQEEYFYGDGEKLVYPAYIGNYISDDELAYGQQFQVLISWSYNGVSVSAPKNAGTYVYSVDSENSLIYDGEISASGLNNYDIQASQSVTIKPVSIRLKLPDLEIVYGEALPFVPNEFIEIPDENGVLKYEGETLKVKIVYYDWDEYAYGRKVEVIPKDADGYIYYAPAYMTYDADGTPHTAKNYDLEVWEGSLLIKERKISVKAIDLPDAVYDDEEVSYPVYVGNHGVIGLDGLPEGQSLQINSVEYYDENGNLIDGVPTEVGVYYIVPVSVTVYDEDGNEVDTDKNYKISFTEIPDCGTVEILPRKILLETNTHLDWVYNGEYRYDTDFTLWLLDDNGIKLKTIDSPENVIILDYTKLKEVSNVVENVVEYDFSQTNYSITQTVWGALKVNHREITVQSATNLDKLVYNGEEQYDEGFKITVGTLADGQEIKVSGHATVTTVDQGIVTNRLTYKIVDAEGEEVTSNYKITDDFGSIKMNPRPVTVETATNTENWIYSGGEYYDYNYGLIDGTLVDGHAMSVVSGTKVIDVSDPVDNDLTFEIVVGGKDVTVNYAITEQYGKLKVNPLHISVTLNNYPDLIYGEPVYPDEFDNYDLANSTPLVSGERLRVTVKYVSEDGTESAFVKNVGTYTVKYNGKQIVKADGSVSTANYVIDYATDGSVTVSPKEIDFALENLSKVYGDDFTGYPTYAIYDGLEYGEAMTVTVDYSEAIDKTTNAGKYAITIASCTIAGVTYGNPVNGVIDCGNYIITFIDGELEVTARRLVVVSGSATKPYDGIALTCTDFDIEKTYAYGGAVGILDWDKDKTVLKYIEGTANSIINAERAYNRARFESVSDNYIVYSHAVGTLEITKVAIEISLKEITGEYFYGDTVNYYTGAGNYEGGSGLVGGETLEIGVAFEDENGNFAEPKAVGVYTYAFDIDSSVVYNSIGGAGIDNYDITCVNDYEYSVEISRLAVTITLDNWNSEEYDGYAHEYGGNYTVTEGAFAYGERLEIAVKYYKDGAETGAPVNAGDYFVQYDAANSRIGNDLPDRNYDIIILPEDGISFTIRPKNITISMGDERRIYNGMVYNYPADNFNFVADAADGEEIIPVVSYQDGEAPKNAGTYKITLTGFTVNNGLTANYNLVNKSALENGEIFCNLTIDKRDISFTVNDESIELGNDIPKASYTVGGYGFVGEEQNDLVSVYTYYAIGEGGALTPVTEEELNVRGEYAVGLSFIDEKGVLDNYNILGNEYGVLEITARKVTVNIIYTGGDFTYDGDPISLDGLTYSHVHTTNPSESGFLADNIPEHRYSFTDASGNVTYEAPVNAGTYTVKAEFLNVDEDDYAIYNDGSVTITIKPREVTVEITCDGYDDLIYTNTALSRDGVTIAFNGILEKDEGDYTVDWYFYNKTMGRRVTVDYSGDYYVMPEVKGANDNYVIVDYVPTVLFTIAKITVYVTPVGEKVNYEGKSLSLTKYEIRYGAFLDGDELTVTGSSVLSTTVRATVTIKSVRVTQNGLDVTNCYDIHYKYEASDPFNGDKAWYTRENFSAVLEFIPIDIYYTQAVLDTREFAYDGTAHTLYYRGIDISANGFDLSTLITIQNEEDFIGNCTLKLSLMQVKNVLVYKKWIIIQVLNGANKNVTTLYNFILQNEEASQVVVKGYDFKLEIDGDIDDAALKTALANNDSNVFSGTALYGNNEYHILDASLYIASGLDELGHACEVLVREVDGNITVKVIVYGTSSSGSRTEASLYYDFTVATSLSDVSMSLMALLKFDATN